jgi:signal peptidase I
VKKKILIALSIVVVLGGLSLVGTFSYGFRLMSLPTGGMANTILPSENVAATKFYGEIKRGDIMVFKWPKNPNILYIQRVIGLPGETIEMRGIKLFINGQELTEKRVKVDLSANDSSAKTPMQELEENGSGEYRVFYDKHTWETGQGYDHEMKFAANAPFQIPPGQYFMLGDSRDNSLDSRYWGTVSEEAMVSKAYMIFSSAVPERALLQLK